MGDVYVADQLRNVYCFDTWLRNQKWQHALFWWGMQVLLTNVYIIFKNMLELAKAETIFHYGFQKEIAMVWIDPE